MESAEIGGISQAEKLNLAGSKKAHSLDRKPHTEIIAHRGGAGIAPENTVAAFRQALDLGVEWIEIDIRQTRDRQLVCLHDRKLNRTTSGKGFLRRKTLEELRELDAGSWFAPQFAGEVVPTLDEVLELINGRCKLLIEVKRDHPNKRLIAEKLIALIDKHKAREWVVVQSFHPKILKHFFRLDPTVPLNQLLVYKHPSMPFHYDGVVRAGNVFRHSYLSAINLDHRFVNARLVRKIHSRGRKIFCWTVNDEARMHQLMCWGVDGIITDYPDRLLRLRETFVEQTHVLC